MHEAPALHLARDNHSIHDTCCLLYLWDVLQYPSPHRARFKGLSPVGRNLDLNQSATPSLNMADMRSHLPIPRSTDAMSPQMGVFVGGGDFHQSLCGDREAGGCRGIYRQGQRHGGKNLFIPVFSAKARQVRKTSMLLLVTGR